MKYSVFLTLIFSVLLTQACATSNLARQTADQVFPVSEENKMGKEVAVQIEAENKVHQDPNLQAYIRGMGAKIVAAAKNDIPRGIRITFTVVDDPKTVNAFAIPGGNIYIYTGLLKSASSEAEVAGVLGHEVAHVTRRHVAQRLIVMVGADQLIQMASGKDPSGLAGLAGSVAAQGYFLKYSRDHEHDADDFGLDYMVRAGYNPQGFVTFFKKLGDSNVPEFLSTHPDPAGRARTAQERIREMSDTPSYTGEAEFKAKKQEFGL